MNSFSPRAPLLALLLAVSLLSGLATACGNAEAATGPPEINYGRDVCVECGMLISEARFAAAHRLDDGTEKKFDDVGGMLKHGRENDEMAGAVAWVHDFTTEEWVEADAAFYVPTRSVATPMAHGIVAFADHGRASEFAAGVDGEVIDWETVLLLPIVDGLVGHHHDRDTDAGDDGEMDHDEMDHEGTDDNDMDHEEMNHDMESEA
jgi:copper chaperone NosL